MSVSVETLGDLGRRITVTVASESVQKRINKQLEQERTKAAPRGFRKGAVPKGYFEKQYKGYVQSQILPELIQESMQSVLVEQQLTPVARPDVKIVTFAEGKDFVYTADFEIFPQIELQPYSALVVEKRVANVTDKDIDNTINKLKDQFATWKSVDRKSATDDKIVFDVETTVEGKKAEKQKDASVIIGFKGLIPGLSEGLTKRKAGDVVTLNLEYPSDWTNTKFAGKKVTMECVIKSVDEKELPSAEKMAEMFGQAGKMDEFRAGIKERMEKELQETIHNEVKERVLEQMIQKHTVTMPVSLLDQEKQAIQQEVARNNAKQPAAMTEEEITQEATRRVVLGLLMNEVIRKHSLKADPKKIGKQIQSIAMNYAKPDEVVKAYLKNKDLLASVERMVLLDEAVEVILKEAKVIDKSASYEDIIYDSAS